MSKVITINAAHNFIPEGILHVNDIRHILGERNEDFPNRFYEKYMRLLNRFQICCPIDDQRVLVPSKLPEKNSSSTSQQEEKSSVDLTSMLTRIHYFPCIPFGFWSRFISRVLMLMTEMLCPNNAQNEETGESRQSSTSTLDDGASTDPQTGSCEGKFDFLESVNLSDGGICRINMARTSSIVLDSGLAHRLLPERRGRAMSEVVRPRTLRKKNSFYVGDDDDKNGNGETNGRSDGDDEDDDLLPQVRSRAMTEGMRPRGTDKRETFHLENTPNGDGESIDVQVFLDDGNKISFEKEQDYTCDADKTHQEGQNSSCSIESTSVELDDASYSSTSKSLSDMSSIETSTTSDTSQGYNPVVTTKKLLAHLAPPPCTSSATASDEDCLHPSLSATSLSPSVSSDSLPPAVPAITDLHLRDVLATVESLVDTVVATLKEDDKALSSALRSASVASWRSSVSSFSSVGTPENLRLHASGNVHSIWNHGKRKDGPRTPPRSDFKKKNFRTATTTATTTNEVLVSVDNDCSQGNYDNHSLKFTNIGALMDSHVLTCWKNGITFDHPELFFSVEEIDSPMPDRKAVETKVSNSPLGWRVLGFILDHLRTIVTEWYPGLSGSDGNNPYVLQRIACPVCIRTGIQPPRYFDILTLFNNLYGNHSSTTISCIYTHWPRVIGIGDMCPELVFKDLPSTLQIQADKLHYKNQSDHMLGSGTYGQVYRGRYNGIEAAVKEYKFCNDDNVVNSLDVFFNVRQEIFILSKLQSNPFIVGFLGFATHPKLCAVMERACHGTLKDALRDPTQTIERILMFRIAQQMAAGLAFIHSRYIIHRDIKPDNVLLFSLNQDAPVNVKITDFGTALFSSPSGLNDMIGTPGFIAPEMYDFCSSDEYTSKVDVYSLAMVLCEMITNRSPFHDLTQGPQVTTAVRNGERPGFSDVIASKYGLLTLTQVMVRMWKQDCTERPEANAVLEQLNSCAFQMLYGKRVLKMQNPRFFCNVIACSELWVASDDIKGKKITIIDTETSEIKESIPIDGDDYGLSNCNLVHFTALDSLQMVLILQGPFEVMLTVSVKQRKITNSFTFENEHVTAIHSSPNFVFIGYGNGRFTRVLKKNFTKRKLHSYSLDIDTHLNKPITAMLNNFDNLVVGCGGSLQCYRVDFHNTERVVPVVRHISTQHVEDIVLSFDEEMIYVSFQCSPEIQCFKIDNLERVGSCNIESIIWNNLPEADTTDTRVSCMCTVYDVLWVGAGSGSLLLFEVIPLHMTCGAVSEVRFQLVKHLEPYGMETRNLSVVELAKPRLPDEKYLIVSSGRSINPEVFGADPLCQLDDSYPVDGTSLVRRYSTDILNLDEASATGQRNKREKFVLMWQGLNASSLKNMKSY